MMINPFQIDADAIARLDEDTLVRIVNRLIRAEARRLHVPPNEVLTSLRINDPDGGVDAQVNAGAVMSAWLPAGTSIWQFKGGKQPPSRTALRKEVNKPAVRQALETGATYCLVLGIDLPPIRAQGMKSLLREQIDTVKQGAPYQLVLAPLNRPGKSGGSIL